MNSLSSQGVPKELLPAIIFHGVPWCSLSRPSRRINCRPSSCLVLLAPLPSNLSPQSSSSSPVSLSLSTSLPITKSTTWKKDTALAISLIVWDAHGLFQEGVKAMGSEVKEEDCLAIIAIKTGGGGRCNQLEELRRNQGNQRAAQSHPVTNCEERLELSLLPFHTSP